VALRGLPLTVKPMLGDGFAEIDAALDALPRPRLLIVDSLQLVAPPLPTARTEERAALSARALKALALRRDVAVLTTAQLPLFKAARPDPRPTLADHGGRGAIRQIADVVLGLYREEMYANAQGVEGAAELLVSKQRNGPTGVADLYFYRRFLRFEDMVDPST
jgi:replicative DNA helicase